MFFVILSQNLQYYLKLKNLNGVLHLSIICRNLFLVGLLSTVPLKSKLVSIVLGPWFVDT